MILPVIFCIRKPRDHGAQTPRRLKHEGLEVGDEGRDLKICVNNYLHKGEQCSVQL